MTTMTPAMHRVLRPLNDTELETIIQALTRMSRSNARDAWAAKAMLEEGMAEKFWWMNGEP